MIHIYIYIYCSASRLIPTDTAKQRKSFVGILCKHSWHKHPRRRNAWNLHLICLDATSYSAGQQAQTEGTQITAMIMISPHKGRTCPMTVMSLAAITTRFSCGRAWQSSRKHVRGATQPNIPELPMERLQAHTRTAQASGTLRKFSQDECL